MNQTSMEIAGNLRDVGIERSASRAERASPGWTDLALAFVRGYCLSAVGLFTAEQIVDEFNVRDDLIKPPSDKAWGAVLRKACKRGYIAIVDNDGRRRKGHCSPCPRYRSLITGKRITEVA